jgi:hypothetical protein
MEQGRTSGATGREAPVEDPVQIRGALAELKQVQAEFPIRVEGTHTLPYTSHIHHLDLDGAEIHLKLIRPLPHEMKAGAPFEMTFSAGEQRFTAPITFLGRDSYLIYRFTLPLRMLQCDRRLHKRYPFRPREKAYVLAQDAGLPGHGLAGPLVNLSLGGLAFRVDRILRLDDHLCVPPSSGFFERGKELPLLKIRDLPKLPLFETRGIIANSWERGSEVIVGIKFAELRESEMRQIQAVIDLRELMQRSPAQLPGRDGTGKETHSEANAQNDSVHSRRVNPAGSRTPDALKRLGRRCTSVLLAMPPGPSRDQVKQGFLSLGYLRLQAEDSLEAALAQIRRLPDTSNPVLAVELPADPGDALAAILACQQELGEGRDLPVALLGAEGSLSAFEQPLLCPLAWPISDPALWLPVLDDLAGI